MEVKNIANRTWAALKPDFFISHQEFKGFAVETVVDSGFQKSHLVAQLLESIFNVFHPTDNDTEDDLLQMLNGASQPTQISLQLVHQMQQIKMILEHMQTQFNNNTNNNEINNGGNENSTGGGNKIPFWRQLHFWNNGACNHQCSSCLSKAEGHKYTVTLDNHLNGSNCSFQHCESKDNIL